MSYYASNAYSHSAVVRGMALISQLPLYQHASIVTTVAILAIREGAMSTPPQLMCYKKYLDIAL